MVSISRLCSRLAFRSCCATLFAEEPATVSPLPVWVSSLSDVGPSVLFALLDFCLTSCSCRAIFSLGAFANSASGVALGRLVSVDCEAPFSCPFSNKRGMTYKKHSNYRLEADTITITPPSSGCRSQAGVGSGITSPSCPIPCRCNFSASFALRNASSRSWAQGRQPGRSGNSTEIPSSPQ